jgi:Lhr-like helicase
MRSGSPLYAVSVGTWERVVDLVATAYTRSGADLSGASCSPDGLWRARNDDIRRQHRMNIRTIIEDPMISVRMVSFSRSDSATGGGQQA